MVEVVALMNWYHIRMITTEHFTLRGIPLTEATFLLKAAPWRCVNTLLGNNFEWALAMARKIENSSDLNGVCWGSTTNYPEVFAK